jgi:hypothetical protein
MLRTTANLCTLRSTLSLSDVCCNFIPRRNGSSCSFLSLVYSCSFMSTCVLGHTLLHPHTFNLTEFDLLSLNMRSYIHTELRNSDDNTVLPLSFRMNKSTVSAQLDAVNPSHSTHSLGKVTATEVAVSSPGGQPYTIRIDRSVHVD